MTLDEKTLASHRTSSGKQMAGQTNFGRVLLALRERGRSASYPKVWALPELRHLRLLELSELAWQGE